MNVPTTIDASAWLGKYLEGANGDTDLARSMLAAFAEALMSADASMQCNAAYGERTPDARIRGTGIGCGPSTPGSARSSWPCPSSAVASTRAGGALRHAREGAAWGAVDGSASWRGPHGADSARPLRCSAGVPDSRLTRPGPVRPRSNGLSGHHAHGLRSSLARFRSSSDRTRPG